MADDQRLVREGVVTLVNSQPDLTVVGQATDGVEAVSATLELVPDVTLMDLRMPNLDGVLATAEILRDPRCAASTRILALSTFNDDESVLGSLRAGASGYVVKDAAPAQLIEAIRAVSRGESWIDPTVAGQVLAQLRTRIEANTDVSELRETITEREREVLVLIAQGLSNTEISQRLVLSIATVRTHVSRILLKTGSRDRAQAVALAYRSGLVVAHRDRSKR